MYSLCLHLGSSLGSLCSQIKSKPSMKKNHGYSSQAVESWKSWASCGMHPTVTITHNSILPMTLLHHCRDNNLTKSPGMQAFGLATPGLFLERVQASSLYLLIFLEIWKPNTHLTKPRGLQQCLQFLDHQGCRWPNNNFVFL